MNSWTTHESEYKAILDEMARLASQKGYILNKDEERVRKVVGLMTENFVNAGKYYCPCKQSHPLDPSKDAVCSCPPWEEEIAKDGHCFCRLFFKKED
jgi:ferredoxin-thioredoxin reductase catalytic subunit